MLLMFMFFRARLIREWVSRNRLWRIEPPGDRREPTHTFHPDAHFPFRISRMEDDCRMTPALN